MTKTIGKVKQTGDMRSLRSGIKSEIFLRQEFMILCRSRMFPMKSSRKSASPSIESNMWSLPADEGQS